MTRPHALRPCVEPGCGTLVRGGGRCPECAAKASNPRRREHAPGQRRFYGSTRWKKIRALVLGQEPTCRLCGQRPSEVCDHVNGDWRDNRRSNLRGLCRPCNDSHTGRQHRAKRQDAAELEPETEALQAPPEPWWFV